jgi:hypothetical protein
VAAQVQSVDRVFALLECLADGGGSLSLSELAAQTRLPMPTIHRLARSLDLPPDLGETANMAMLDPSIRLADSPSRIILQLRRPGALAAGCRPSAISSAPPLVPHRFSRNRSHLGVPGLTGGRRVVADDRGLDQPVRPVGGVEDLVRVLQAEG